MDKTNPRSSVTRGSCCKSIVQGRRGPNLTMTFAVNVTNGLVHYQLHQGGMTAEPFNQFLEDISLHCNPGHEICFLFDNAHARPCCTRRFATWISNSIPPRIFSLSRYMWECFCLEETSAKNSPGRSASWSSRAAIRWANGNTGTACRTSDNCISRQDGSIFQGHASIHVSLFWYGWYFNVMNKNWESSLRHVFFSFLMTYLFSYLNKFLAVFFFCICYIWISYVIIIRFLILSHLRVFLWRQGNFDFFYSANEYLRFLCYFVFSMSHLIFLSSHLTCKNYYIPYITFHIFMTYIFQKRNEK